MNTTTERTKEAMLVKMQLMNKENGLNPEFKKMAVMNFKNAIKVGNKILLDVPLELLKIDHDMYQRPLQRHVRTIAKDWNEDKCDPLMVNYRSDGFFYVIDGQHRFEAAFMRGIESLVCVVFVGLSIKEEADLFTEQNEGTKKLTPYDTYKANICREEVIDMSIKSVCDKYGIKVEKSNTIKTLKSVTAARKIVKHYGKEHLDFLFGLLEDAGWYNFKETYGKEILESVHRSMISRLETLTYSKEKLVDFFKNSTPKELIALANVEYPYIGRVTGLCLIFDEIINDDNSGIKNKLVKIA